MSEEIPESPDQSDSLDLPEVVVEEAEKIKLILSEPAVKPEFKEKVRKYAEDRRRDLLEIDPTAAEHFGFLHDID